MNTERSALSAPDLDFRPKSLSLGKAIASITVSSLLCSASATVIAQDGQSLALEEVVVTAQRREEGLQSIPVSIAAVTAEDLDDKGITSFTQLSDAVSGIALSRPGSAVSAGVYVRGVGTAGTSPAAQSVGVMVDGVYLLRSGTAFNELMDLERVEILRGPQGTLFGKNTTAGLVNLVTADPQLDTFSGQLQGVVGNLDNLEVRGVINIPLIEERLGFRITGFNAERDGYTQRTNRTTGVTEDTRNIDRHGYRAKLLWEATDNFEIKATVENIDNEQRMDQANVTTGVAIGDYLQGPGFVFEEIDRYILNLRWDVANHTISTISSIDDSTSFLYNDFDESDLVDVWLSNEGDTKATTHELQVSSDFDGPLSYIFGYFFQNEELVSATIINGNPRPLTERDVDSEAVFGNVNYAFNDQWSASLGARYTEDEFQGNNVFAPEGEIRVFDEWTYSAKLTYQMDVDTMLYASQSTGFKAGGINPVASVDNASQRYWEPETTDAFELGIKSELLDNRLRLNAALFYQTYKDFQVTRNLPGEARTIVSNAAEVESTGLEAEFTAAVTEILMLSGSVTWVKSEYESNERQACTVPGYPGCFPVEGGNFARDISGETLDHAPELSYNLGAELRSGFDWVGGTEWFARADVVYKDDQNLEVWLPTEAEEGSYYLFNMRAGLEYNDAWKVTIWADNVFDEEYRAEAYWGGVNPILRAPNFHEIPGLERTYGLTVDWSF